MLLQSEDQDLGLSVGHLDEDGGLGLSVSGKINDRKAKPWDVSFTLNIWRMREPRSLRLSTTL